MVKVRVDGQRQRRRAESNHAAAKLDPVRRISEGGIGVVIFRVMPLTVISPVKLRAIGAAEGQLAISTDGQAVCAGKRARDGSGY